MKGTKEHERLFQRMSEEQKLAVANGDLSLDDVFGDTSEIDDDELEALETKLSQYADSASVEKRNQPKELRKCWV